MTQDIKHHLTDDLLMGYSTGALPEAFNLVVATHLSLCDDCRATASAYDAVGGAVLDSDDTADVSESAFAATMKLINDAATGTADATNQSQNRMFPLPLQSYLGNDGKDIKWRPLGMGVRQIVLPTSKDATVRLLQIPAGVAVPDHGHRGTELTLVLQGAFFDEFDRFGPGDVEVANQNVQHMPVAEAGEDCICLAATDAPLKFNNLIPRIAQPFLKI